MWFACQTINFLLLNSALVALISTNYAVGLYMWINISFFTYYTEILINTKLTVKLYCIAEWALTLLIYIESRLAPQAKPIESALLAIIWAYIALVCNIIKYIASHAWIALLGILARSTSKLIAWVT